MATVVNSYRLSDGATVLEYSDGSKAYVHYTIPVDESGNVITGGSGGGGAVTVADGADVTQGAKADSAATDSTSAWTVVSLLKGILARLLGTLAVDGSAHTQPVSGTFWQATQPVSAASLPLPASAAQDGTDGSGITPPTGAAGIRGWLSGIFNKLNTSIAVTGTFWQAKQPVSMADGDSATIGTTTDTSTASTLVGLLKAIKAAVTGVLTTAHSASATVTGVSWSFQSALAAAAVVVKASAGNLYGVRIYNSNSAVVYIQLFNNGAPTVGTTTPDDVIPVPAGGVLQDLFPEPVTFATAISAAATTTYNGNTAPTTALIATFFYK